jgi:hypothetical protein
MNRTTTLWIEILPGEWPSYYALPYSVKVGRILRRQPKQGERHLFTKVTFTVDIEERYGANRGVSI